MPRTVIATSNVVPQQSAALALQAVDAANGMMFVNDGTCVLVVSNGSEEPVKVTIVAVPDEAGRAVDYEEIVAPLSIRTFGYYLPAWWNQTTQNLGFVYVDFDYADPNIAVGVLNF